MSKPIAEAKFYAMTAEAAVKALQSDAGRGLSGSEAKKRLGVYGENRLQKGKKTSFAKKFMLQFGDFMVLILLIASAVSFAVSCMQGEANLADPLLILGIVIANAFVGTVQEAKAERALEALRTLSAPHADVLRDGKRAVISAEALVPGDVVYIRAGDVVPADLRLLESMHLQAEESALTGESVPSGKSANAVCDETCGAAERKNMLFSGTGISAGQGVGIVTATGMQTEMGRIAAMLGDEETPDTPLKLRLRRTGKLIGRLVLGICAAIFLIGLIQKAEPLEMFMISISLAVAAIPEGLPAVVTIVLALGVRRMAAKRAIIRHLPAVETLGSCEVICSDKTGTLTQNKMTVVRCAGAAGELNGQDKDALLSAAALCTSVEGSDEKLLGDPTETAIVAAVSDWERLQKQRVKAAEVPFTAERTANRGRVQGHHKGRTGGDFTALHVCAFKREERYVNTRDAGGTERKKPRHGKRRAACSGGSGKARGSLPRDGRCGGKRAVLFGTYRAGGSPAPGGCGGGFRVQACGHSPGDDHRRPTRYGLSHCRAARH